MLSVHRDLELRMTCPAGVIKQSWWPLTIHHMPDAAHFVRQQHCASGQAALFLPACHAGPRACDRVRHQHTNDRTALVRSRVTTINQAATSLEVQKLESSQGKYSRLQGEQLAKSALYVMLVAQLAACYPRLLPPLALPSMQQRPFCVLHLRFMHTLPGLLHCCTHPPWLCNLPRSSSSGSPCPLLTVHHVPQLPHTPHSP
jgi:hypothetical protein